MEIQQSLEKYKYKANHCKQKDMCQKYKDRAVSANIRTFGGKNKDAMLVSANTKAMAKIRRGGKVF